MTKLTYIFLQEPGAQGWSTLMLFGGMFLIMYFLMIRPNLRKQKQEKKYQEELKRGDWVVTLSGIHGKVFELNNETVILETGAMGRAAVPSGASTGKHEAVELRDQDPRYFLGKGVQKAVDFVNNDLFNLLSGQESINQRKNDKMMIELDGGYANLDTICRHLERFGMQENMLARFEEALADELGDMLYRRDAWIALETRRNPWFGKRLGKFWTDGRDEDDGGSDDDYWEGDNDGGQSVNEDEKSDDDDE